MTSALIYNNKHPNSFFQSLSSDSSSDSSSQTSSTSCSTNSDSTSSSLASSSSSSGAISALVSSTHQQFTHIISGESEKHDNNKANDISTSLSNTGNAIVNNLRNMMNTNLTSFKAEKPDTTPVEIPITHVTTQPVSNKQQQQQSSETSSSSCTEFIDPSELKNKFYEFSSKFLLILLDCRTYNDFNMKHIKDSVHLNCRDKLTRKRLQSRKLTVKDLISSEEIKNKFDETSTCPNKTSSTSSDEQVTADNAFSQTDSVVNASSPEQASKIAAKNASNMIVLYDDKTNDISELSDQNPLKIVQDNIKQSGYKKDCRILKGGFKSFFESFPEFCIMKDCDEQQRIFFNKHKEYFTAMKDDQRQSAIDRAVMTEITPYLFLGNEQDAKNCDLLEKKGIYYILNVTKNIPFYNSTNSMGISNDNGQSSFCYKRIAVNDCENQNLKNHFEEAFEFIDQAKMNNQKVLVHCQAGISRSPTIVIAYLMSRFNLEMNDSYDQVKLQRPIIGPNLIFMSQLQDFDALLKHNKSLIGTSTVTPINVVHTNLKDDNANNTLNNTNLTKPRPCTPPSTPVHQIDIQLVSTQQPTKKSENSENNSPDTIKVNSTGNSYFKMTQSTSSTTSNIKCNSTTNEQKNNSILVFN